MCVEERPYMVRWGEEQPLRRPRPNPWNFEHGTSHGRGDFAGTGSLRTLRWETILDCLGAGPYKKEAGESSGVDPDMMLEAEIMVIWGCEATL